MPCAVTPTSLTEVLMMVPKVFGDDRGFFGRFKQRDFQQATVLDSHFALDNHSKSSQGVPRGRLYQIQLTCRVSSDQYQFDFLVSVGKSLLKPAMNSAGVR